MALNYLTGGHSCLALDHDSEAKLKRHAELAFGHGWLMPRPAHLTVFSFARTAKS
jgi:hypothetical protein